MVLAEKCTQKLTVVRCQVFARRKDYPESRAAKPTINSINFTALTYFAIELLKRFTGGQTSHIVIVPSEIFILR